METAPPSPEPAPAPAPRKRRLRRILLIVAASFVVLILAVFLGAPPLIASTIRSQFIASVEKNLEAKATVGAVSFSWTGRVAIRDIDIKDRAGATIASVKAAIAQVGVLSALKGKYVADFRLESPRVELRRGDDGRLNIASITKPSTPKASEPAKTSGPMSIPDFEARLDIDNALVVIAGGKENSEFPLTGRFVLKSAGGIMTLDGKNVVKDGSFDLSGSFDLRDSAPATSESKADFTLKQFPLDARMGPMLELLHPAFSMAAGSLDGVADGTVSIRHRGSILKPGEDPLKALGGQGRLEIRDCSFSGSNLLGELLKAIGKDKREIRLKPVEFKIVDGRIVYEKPWQWTISGSDTTFTGSIGLDRTLDMAWRVPVTDDLVARVPALKSSRGKEFEVPIGGTVSKPRLDWKGLVGQAAEDKIEEAAKKGLENLLGGKDEKKAQKLLDEGDTLHKQGKLAEAAAKYRKIKDEYRKSRVYKENKDRIDPRSEAK